MAYFTEIYRNCEAILAKHDPDAMKPSATLQPLGLTAAEVRELTRHCAPPPQKPRKRYTRRAPVNEDALYAEKRAYSRRYYRQNKTRLKRLARERYQAKKQETA